MDATWLLLAGQTASCEQLPVFSNIDNLNKYLQSEVEFLPSLEFRSLRAVDKDSYLVDPASSHMLVSKIKPCMSKYKQFIQ